MAVYPGAIASIPANKQDDVDTITGVDAGTSSNAGDHAAHHNQLASELVAVQGELGTDPSGSYATVKERLDAAGAGYSDEQARDAIGAALVAGTGVKITVNDGANTITIAAAPGIPIGLDPTGATDNQSIVQAALSAGGLVRLPFPGAYKLGSPITVPVGSKLLIDDGAYVFMNVDAAADSTPAITVSGHMVGQAIGPGNQSVALGTVPCNRDGIVVLDKGLLEDVDVRGWRAGVMIRGNHQRLFRVRSTNNYFNCWWADSGSTFGDQTLVDCDFTGAKFASIAVGGGNVIDGCEFIGGHSGFAPYGIYSYVVGSHPFMFDTVFLGHRFEACGNAIIQDDSRARDIYNVEFDHCWSGFNASYKIAGLPADYAIEAGQILHCTIKGSHTFQSPGALALIRAKQFDDIDWQQANLAIDNIVVAGVPLITGTTVDPTAVRLHHSTGRAYDHNFLDTERVDPVNTVAAAGTTETLPDPTLFPISDITLNSASCAFTFPTAQAGKHFQLLLRQDATGGRAATWPAAVQWPGGADPTLTAGASAKDMFTFVCIAGVWYGLKDQNFS